MNEKIAKRLRKEANYHPTTLRNYHVVNKSTKPKNFKTGEMKTGTVELLDTDSRVLYNEIKKEFYTKEK